jgi:hypothetical protein
LQIIHKFRLVAVRSDLVVKVAVLPVRLGGGFAVLLYTLVGRYRFPNPLGDQDGSAWDTWAPRGFVVDWKENRQLQQQERFNSQPSAVSYELSAKAKAGLFDKLGAVFLNVSVLMSDNMQPLA